ncbi:MULTISPECIES: hypothetical protein [Pseudomonas]|uniref:Uncharacterized protein n=1 Tax=Pseudomonas asplenii TaxID=53407 RepID=A0A0M9GCH2_9PSED|nr:MULTISPECIES: hypothetical protein [Pseudomonas]KPA87677.1 hypothetical protein PF66_05897 [Pseudomonas fuscovaginae]KPA99141.1 hypothetical protein PF70_00744 [Pseudomonas fuscovaginae]
MDLSSDISADQTCMVLLRINQESLRRDGFLFELASHVEGWAGVEILSVEFGRRDEHAPGPADVLA